MPEQNQAPAVPSGQGPTGDKVSPRQGTTPSASKQPAVGSAAFEYEWEDGRKDSFATMEDLKKAWREGHLRRDDYTKKTQELAEQRKAMEAERKQYAEMMANVQRMQSQWEPVDTFLKSRPDIRDYILQNMRYPNHQAIAETAKNAVNQDVEELRKQLQELAEWKEQQAEAERRAAVYDHLSKQYEDFDPEVVEQALTEFNELPDGEEIRWLAERIYQAHKGREIPKKIEERVVQNLETKARKMPPVPPSQAARETPEETPRSLREAARIYKEKHKD